MRIGIHSRPRRPSALVYSALLAAIVMLATGAPVARASDPTAPAIPATGFAPIVKQALPAVVNVFSTRNAKASQNNPFDDPIFRQFFGPQNNVPRDRRERSLGSGVIVNPDGYILTNNHVVEDASEVRVALQDKREFTAQVVGTDPQTDIAVLKIDATSLPTLPLGDSTGVQIGDIVLAIGNPFGVGETVTMGIVSAKGRGIGILGNQGYEDFIQTDAAINPGNSGGALINAEGQLIGINSAILANGTEGNQGVGFAVPVNLARRIMEQIVETGKVTRGWLGLSIQDVTPTLAKAFSLPRPSGALVSEVLPNSPAARAGIKAGDVITTVNGQAIDDVRQLRLRVAALAPGSTVPMTVVSNGTSRNVTVTLGEAPATPSEAATTNEAPTQGVFGIETTDLTPDVARQLGLNAGVQGAVVVGVRPDSPAERAGLQRGDVIRQIDRKPVTSAAELQQALSSAGNTVLLRVQRGNGTVYVAMERPATK